MGCFQVSSAEMSIGCVVSLVSRPEYDIASLFRVSVLKLFFVTKACARRPGAAASQAFERMHILC